MLSQAWSSSPSANTSSSWYSALYPPSIASFSAVDTVGSFPSSGISGSISLLMGVGVARTEVRRRGSRRAARVEKRIVGVCRG